MKDKVRDKAETRDHWRLLWERGRLDRLQSASRRLASDSERPTIL